MPARSHAQKAFTFSKLPKGSLRLSDLGYFNLGEFKKNGEEEKYWFSRLHLGRATFDEEGKPLNLLQWLKKQKTQRFERLIKLGNEEKLEMRVIGEKCLKKC